MPLSFLGNKFSPKKGPPRKCASLSNLNYDAEKRMAEFGIDVGPIKAKLGDYVLELQEDGKWFLGIYNNYFRIFNSSNNYGLLSLEFNMQKYHSVTLPSPSVTMRLLPDISVKSEE